MRWEQWMSVVLVGWIGLGCGKEASGFELNERRIAELANATCSCSDSISKRDCSASYKAVLQATLVAQVDAGRVRVRTELWNECIAELHACRPNAQKCEELFEGTRTQGQACDATSRECAPGLRCTIDPDADPDCSLSGTCEEIETIERGERCVPGDRCERGDICGVDPESGGLIADAGSDGGIDAGDEDGGSDGGSDGGDDLPAQTQAETTELELICRRPLEEGDACPIDRFGMAGVQLCEPGLGCVPEDDDIVCGEPRKEGERCSYMIGAQSVAGPCVKGTFCGAAGACERFPFPEGAEQGEDCDVRDDCLPGLVCVDGECAIPLANGEPCGGPGECAAHCADERCAPAFVACEL